MIGKPLATGIDTCVRAGRRSRAPFERNTRSKSPRYRTSSECEPSILTYGLWHVLCLSPGIDIALNAGMFLLTGHAGKDWS